MLLMSQACVSVLSTFIFSLIFEQSPCMSIPLGTDVVFVLLST